MWSMDARRARRIELIVATALTFVLLGAHLAHLFYAGPLWRDEIASLNFATKPSWSDFWAAFSLDIFPGLFFLLLRGWHAIVGDDDFKLRILGCLIGMALVAAFWINARLTRRKTPIVTLLLFGFCPTLLIWGDTLRAYGLGVLGITLCFGLFWRVIERPGAWEIALATLVALVSVQSIYTNALLVFACGMAAVAVAVRRRQWGRAGIVLAIGGVAALSLLPYVGFLRGSSGWASLYRVGFPISASLQMLSAALLGPANALLWTWILLVTAGFLSAIFLQPRFAECRDSAFYALVAAVLAFVVTMTYFRVVGWGTNIWYYLPMLAVMSASIDLLWDFRHHLRLVPLARAALTLLVLVITFPTLYGATLTRLSNLDLISDIIAKRATPGDLVIVYPYVDAVSFKRYYHGPIEWMTIPTVAHLPLQHPDDLLDELRRPDAIVPALDKIRRTLQSDHKVWLASTWGWQPPAERPPPVAPLRSNDTRFMGHFLRGWERSFQYVLRAHAEEFYVVPVPSDTPIAHYERSQLYLFSGWHDQPANPKP
ncbi:MAG: mannosyltransferase [Verrucomicrobiota bacterium]|jgi:hypothetical protein